MEPVVVGGADRWLEGGQQASLRVRSCSTTAVFAFGSEWMCWAFGVGEGGM